MEHSVNSSYKLETDADVVRVVQLTDTHLCRTLGGTLLGMDTDHSPVSYTHLTLPTTCNLCRSRGSPDH